MGQASEGNLGHQLSFVRYQFKFQCHTFLSSLLRRKNRRPVYVKNRKTAFNYIDNLSVVEKGPIELACASVGPVDSLLQREPSSEIFHVKISLICMKINL